jgi:hypothetical protein
MVFTNKHFIIAMIVAPILAILAWFAAGEFAGEVPQQAEPGQSYPLVEKSSCRYPSGVCELENEDFRLSLSPRQGESGAELVLLSSHPLDGVVLGVGDIEQQVEPAAMRATDGQGLEWRLLLDRIPAPTERIRLVAMAGGSSYFADAATLFLQPDDN